jgi:hypothetical protein
MGFNGGGGGQLLNHQHDGSLVFDGGPLDFKNITQSSMSAGSITQSDGAHLQELLIGTPTQVPRVNGAGTALEYHSPVDIVGSLELLDSDKLVAAGANVTVSGTWTAADYSCFIIKGGFQNDNSAGTPSLRFRINNSSANDYVTNMILNTAGTLSATTSGFQTSGLICTSNIIQPSSTETVQVYLTLQMSEQNAGNTYRPSWSTTDCWDQGGATPSDTEQSTGYLGQNSVNTLSKVDFFMSDGSNLSIGSNLQLYGIKRT